MAELSTLDNLDDSFALAASSPESLREQSLTSPQATDHETAVGAHYDHSADSDIEDDFESHDLTLRQRQSTGSSVSSFPASIIHHDSYFNEPEYGLRTPSKSQSVRSHQNDRIGSPGYGKFPRSHIAGFRNPSSVRMQMYESEYDESDVVTPNSRRKEPRLFSHRSSNSLYSTPTKRSSRSNTPHKRHSSVSKLKKEFPLVLLHCTLLKPAVACRGPLVADDILEAVLPEEYRKRWRTLQDKITKNPEVYQRGVLIPHPRDDYDLLEERLLESLELERPRIRQNHYLGGKDTDSGFESSSSHTDSTSSEGEDDQELLGQKCPDCGKHVTLTQVEQEKKWEVKVYAANGLMRGGAWAAAWSEMEKVDVEVGAWMPEDVRREVDARLAALQQRQEEVEAAEAELQEVQEQSRNQKEDDKGRRRPRGHRDERMKEIYGETLNKTPEQRQQDEIDGLDDTNETKNMADPATPRYSRYSDVRDFAVPPTIPSPGGWRTGFTEQQPSQPELRELIQRRIQTMLQDQRNIAIILLSILVMFFAISSAPTPVKEPSQSVSSTLSAPVSSLQVTTDVLEVPLLRASPPLLSTIQTDNVIATVMSIASSPTMVSDSPMIELDTFPPTNTDMSEENLQTVTNTAPPSTASEEVSSTDTSTTKEQAEAKSAPIPASDEALFISENFSADAVGDDSRGIDSTEEDEPGDLA